MRRIIVVDGVKKMSTAEIEKYKNWYSHDWNEEAQVTIKGDDVWFHSVGDDLTE